MAADELLATRREKLERLRAGGVEPYPHAFPGVVPVAAVHSAHPSLPARAAPPPPASLPAGADPDRRYRVAGRLHARRGQGKMAFLDLDDRSGRIQLQARRDVLGDEAFERLLNLDLGDLLGAEGTIFKTRRGELSVAVQAWELLAKSL